jgi:hypothetical protein
MIKDASRLHEYRVSTKSRIYTHATERTFLAFSWPTTNSSKYCTSFQQDSITFQCCYNREGLPAGTWRGVARPADRGYDGYPGSSGKDSL